MTLNLINVFSSLNDKVRYAHFKSNMHLDASLKGETDFDILVDRRDQEAFVKIMLENNFVRMRTASVNRYEGVEDWVAFSDQSLRIIHFHIHWDFVVGQPNVKQYCLPMSDIILRSVTTRNIDGTMIKCVTPSMELEILIIRSYLKFRKRDLLRYVVTQKVLASDLNIEFNWLMSQMNEISLDAQKLRFSSLPVIDSIRVLKSNKIYKYLIYVWLLRNEYKNFRVFSPLEVLFKRYWSELQKRLVSNLIKGNRAVKRTPNAGGLTVHFVGIDGAGKSTIQNALHDLLGKKVDVAKIYFGIGDGEKSWHRNLLEFFVSKNKYTKHKNNCVKKTIKLSSFKKFKRSIYAISIAMEKRSKLRKLLKLRAKGFIIICDRYPQFLIERDNDGFILDKENFNTGLWRFTYGLEQKIMKSFEQYHCDILFLLDISAKNAYDRKGEEPIEFLEQKNKSLRLIIENDNRAKDIVMLDAMTHHDDLMRKVSSVIWRYLH